MDINDIVQTIAEARIDARSLSEFVFKPSSFKVTRRLAPPINTLNYYIDYLDGLKAVYTQQTGTVTVNGVQVKAITQAVKDALNSAAIDNNTQVDTLVTATAKHVGAIPRTQADKNSDVISITDFSSPDAAYTYAVDNKAKLYVPKGDFLIARAGVDYSLFYGLGTINGLQPSYLKAVERAQGFDVQELGGDKNSFDRYLLSMQGEGSETVIPQDFTIDNKSDELFTSYVINDPEQCVINKFNATRATQTAKRWLKNPSLEIGHQGLSVCYDGDGERWFAHSAGPSISNKGAKVVLFQIEDDPSDSEGLLIKNLREVKVFTTTSNQHCTCTTSLNSRYLIAKLYMPNNKVLFRVFDLQYILGNKLIVDFANEYMSEFIADMDYSYYSLQSIACDNNVIYIFHGAGRYDTPNSVRVAVYDMIGVELYNKPFDVGRDKSYQDGSSNFYEVEGAGWAYVGNEPCLAVQVVSGFGTGRKCRIYQMRKDTSIVATVRDFRRRPAFISEAVNDFAAPHDESLILGHYDANNDFFYKGLEIDSNQNISFSSKNSGDLTVTLHDSPTGGKTSTTTGSGTFSRIGDLVFVNIYISNISITGMTAANNMVVRLSASGTNFKVPTVASCLSMSCNNYTPFAGALMTTPTFSGGVLYFRDCITGGSVELADVSQFAGVTLQISGCYQVS
ncbi:hypothetical protein [Psychrobacter sp. AOP7-A1-24]|uniref:hypothetical protein n=1 Tax=Psychrobacter sp. AOP7-A1-24 TaxID=3457646 RepID=UPI00402B09C0